MPRQHVAEADDVVGRDDEAVATDAKTAADTLDGAAATAEATGVAVPDLEHEPATTSGPEPAAEATDGLESGNGDGAEADTEGSSGSDAPTTPRRRRLRIPAGRRGRIVAAVLVLCVLAGAGTLAWWQITALPADAAFRLDGQVTTVDQLDQRIDALRALYGVEEPQDPAKADGFRRDVAKSVALSDILDKAAADKQVVVADKQVSDTLDRYVEQQFGAGGHDAFVQALGNVGTSESAVRDEIRRQLTVSALMTQVVGTVTVTDDDVKVAYEQRKSTLGTPEKRSLRNIVVKDQQAAQSVLDQLKAGTPIEQLAAADSLDASTKDKGGSIGAVGRTDLEQPVGDAAFGVPVGQPYGPVQGAHGWNVGRVDAITPFVPATFDQVSAGLRQALKVERSLKIWQDWLAQQIRAAGVQYAAAYRPADPDAAPSVDQPSAPAAGGPPR
jgi:peptidyl-prolyl cis-trans isomerase C